jgi:hypothetical protein
VQEEVVDSSLEFLILASDGLWDVVTNEVNTRQNHRFWTALPGASPHCYVGRKPLPW